MELTSTATSLLSAWERTVQAVLNAYGAFGRPILDFLYVVFDKIFNVFLVITVIISVLFLLLTIYNFFHKKKQDEQR